ncbi:MULTISPECIES: catalase [unclassified Polaromonas]|jgi:catalase|uniref:catalase n=1 Tax=unclassified Polaromonas TaxID=2638319 RepID=UPI000BC84129|nr:MULTISPECIES: catalase [unclassified Polaromonas]OYY37443.1 MAG: catalase HPII [Polaromonas sp. 35-63-35]OYZ21535.1 MAG: catalase HPII [Polaromonas sp. 16-63-31]OYZ77676.1 MAG: catalase HPII [Polaromonas sp. 24-63-21]OZA49995.1 MAG: catalase HPII [Polaromonas sp. 17-63-33]OZA87014.1 MAG: catalase HPII [Polaromonas sp. 39-63-25]
MTQPKRSTASAPKLSNGATEKQKQLQAFTADAASTLTTNQGLHIPDNHNSLKAGVRGPTLMEDFILREKITHFDHERIPERAVHARGSAAHGFFKLYKPMTQFTCAGFLQNPELETPVFVRFSTVAGSRGSADTVRDVRGFAVKFYTDEGNYDLVGNNIPVFFIQDAIKFPDLVHALKPEPHNEMPQAASAHDTFWDFVSLMPESTHMLMWAMSDRAIPRSYRMMEGFGVHTFRFINAHGDAHFVKFHWKPKLGVHGLAWDEAQKIAGKDADYHRRDLWEAIDRGDFPEWELGVQIIEEGQEDKLGFDILDPTKLIPESVVPVQLIGKMVLNRNPDNFFAETEQVAFHPGHLVPGIDFTDDPLLQGRLFSYTDTQLSRLGGANFHEIPINRAVCPFHNFQRDGMHRQGISKGRVAYEPNTLATGAEFRVDGGAQGFHTHPQALESPKIRRRSPSFDDHFSHATLFWNSQSPAEKDHIVAAFRFELSKVEVPDIRQRMVDNLAHVDAKLAARVAAPLGINAPDAKAAAGRLGFRDYRIAQTVDEDAALSMAGRPATDNIRTRKVAILVADGVDLLSFKRLQQELLDAGAQCKVVAPQLGPVTTSSGKQLPADHTFSNTSSIMFDAVVIPGGAASAATLAQLGDAVHFVLEAYKHCKTVCALNEGAQLLGTLGFALDTRDGALMEPTAGILLGDSRKAADGQILQALIAAMARHRHWDRLNVDAVPA